LFLTATQPIQASQIANRENRFKSAEDVSNLEDYMLVLKTNPTTNGNKSLNLQRSTNSVCASSSSLSGLDDDTLKLLKHNMSAIPSGLILGGLHSVGKKNKKAKSVSKVFNTVSARPMVQRIKLTPTITAYLEFTFLNVLSTSTTIPTYLGSYITLTTFANYTEYVALFDQYRIDSVEAWIEPTVS
jgi:hypothetical protein